MTRTWERRSTRSRGRRAHAAVPATLALLAAFLLAACGGAAPDDSGSLATGSVPVQSTPPGPTKETLEPPSATPGPGSPAQSPVPAPAPAPAPAPTTAPPRPAAATSLTIVLSELAGGPTTRTTLTCAPAGGTHPDPAAACTAIDAAGGVAAFAPLPRSSICTEIYGGPQTATVRGTVEGVVVDARFARNNGCEIARWDRLAAVLGSAGGV